jgi:hypothetical protein
MSAEETAAARDLDFVRDVLARTQRRIDAHAYQFVWWGMIVLIWYPTAYFLPEHMLTIGAVSLTVGFVGSALMGALKARSSRIQAENTFIGRQIGRVVFGCIAGGVLCSTFAPWSGFIPGPQMATLWALIYAVMAYMVGVVYTREWTVSGIVIFIAAVVAMFLPDHCMIIVGPPMGLGILIPGLIAERRVAAMRRADEAAHAA